MEASDGAAEILVQLISPENLPVCECLHDEEQRGLRSRKLSSAEGQKSLLPFLRSWQPPYFIFLVSILEVGVFVWGGEETQRALVYDPYHREQVWRFLTYMLLHSNTLHLALNVAIQCLLAVPLEHEQGHLRTSLVYLGGVLGGSLGTSMLEPELKVVGASGGVYALLISQLANILLNFGALPYKLHRAVVVAVLALADIAASLYHYFLLGNVCPRISWAAHSSGALAGFLLGLVLFKGSKKPGPTAAHEEEEDTFGWTRVAVWVAATMLGAAVSAAVICNALLTPTQQTTD
ncbi:protein rhomboid-like [Zootermopsis nevadensis]|uniref:protein rhomboid-like n=1 Tax=Zootermopsis nevadensis TaxID=136037 RepID=UPI000B8E9981|nr:protein rhomboid-like [Zootermopsis nevadensis]XP_021915990.1 protein rhomboid-like [Zootermopsis nevadensis]XP_021915991.1 protein rhomboid-like [Zootermopsis nevadensis]XP_021915992.1 protein rhomboid-like [Zootermopsis nevadensis]XP_021915993.1 protein rhomboid-like [Zootermopsis nevadensis]XP_021915994.1 protein rhomboid-like [Zootermopsis nevadensis]